MKRIVFALVAATGLLFAPAAASALASPAHVTPMATNACGGNCVDAHFLQPGDHWLVKDRGGSLKTNTDIVLNLASNAASQEDFTPLFDGTVAPEFCPSSHEAAVDPVFTPAQCALMNSEGLLNDAAYEANYDPDGGGSDMCVGVYGNGSPVSGNLARLEPCGESASTVLILASHLPGGTTNPGSFWVIDGGSSNFSFPLVLTSTGAAHWQKLKWSTVTFNGGVGADNQEVRIDQGPFQI